MYSFPVLGARLCRWLPYLALGFLLVSPVVCNGQDAGTRTTFSIAPDGTSYLPVEVFGEQQQFLIDTGSSQSALDVRFRKRLGAPVVKADLKTIMDSRRIDLFTAPEMKVGSGRPLTFQSSNPICCVDFAAAGSATGVDDFGILGMDFLQTRILWLNFDDGVGEIRPEQALESSHLERLQFLKELPSIWGHLPDEGPKKFLVDTGRTGDSVVLQRDLFDRLLAKRRLVVLSRERISAVDHVVEVRRGVLDCLEFGPHRFFNVAVSEGSGNALGLPFLRRFEIEFDFPKRVARFRQGRQIDAPELRKRVPLGVKRIQGKTTAVVADSAPAEALRGIQDGDRLRSINGASADELSLSKIRLLFCQPGTQIKISFEHEAVTKDVVLQLSNDPDPFPAKSPHELIETTSDFDP